MQVEDLLLELNHVCCLEGHSSVEHSIQDYSCTPNIRLEPFVSLASEHLRSNVCRCATLLSLGGILVWDKLADSEIADLDISFGSKKDVIELYVSVENSF